MCVKKRINFTYQHLKKNSCLAIRVACTIINNILSALCTCCGPAGTSSRANRATRTGAGAKNISRSGSHDRAQPNQNVCPVDSSYEQIWHISQK